MRELGPAIGTTYARLQAIKGEYDPDGLFRANHPIEAA